MAFYCPTHRSPAAHHAQIADIKVIKKSSKGDSAVVEFKNQADGEKALEMNGVVSAALSSRLSLRLGSHALRMRSTAASQNL